MKKAIKIISINFILLAILLTVFKIFSKKEGVSIPSGKKIRSEMSENYLEYNDSDGHQLTSNKVISYKKYYGEETVVDVVYTTNKESYRVTPVQFEGKRDKFAIFFGGSNTFGEALQDNQTIPYYFAKIASNYYPYNFGVPGHGPQHVYLKVKDEKTYETVKQKSGEGFYQYFSFHRRRLMGSMSFLRWADGKFPYLYINSDGDLVRDGSFNTGRPVLTFVLKKLSKIPYFQSPEYDYPKFYSQQTNELMCKVIVESKKEFLKKYPESHFTVIIGRASSPRDPIVDLCLLKNKIQFLDMREEWNEETMGDNRILPNVEEHQRKEVNEFIARKLFDKFIQPKK